MTGKKDKPRSRLTSSTSNETQDTSSLSTETTSVPQSISTSFVDLDDVKSQSEGGGTSGAQNPEVSASALNTDAGSSSTPPRNPNVLSEAESSPGTSKSTGAISKRPIATAMTKFAQLFSPRSRADKSPMKPTNPTSCACKSPVKHDDNCQFRRASDQAEKREKENHVEGKSRGRSVGNIMDHFFRGSSPGKNRDKPLIESPKKQKVETKSLKNFFERSLPFLFGSPPKENDSSLQQITSPEPGQSRTETLDSNPGSNGGNGGSGGCGGGGDGSEGGGSEGGGNGSEGGGRSESND